MGGEGGSTEAGDLWRLLLYGSPNLISTLHSRLRAHFNMCMISSAFQRTGSKGTTSTWSPAKRRGLNIPQGHAQKHTSQNCDPSVECTFHQGEYLHIFWSVHTELPYYVIVFIQSSSGDETPTANS
ncbi:hypothetical protein Q7C36_005424 [Tachysurus vachellii]|uniref:Uncharacterized protein n=1 Tax=Tachysurus vachellii TaxID=175792 RepID=A0AA88NDS8_TACVA|nr:hypothetical protein Q7C36_005424 [Tachysurus vachellii]